MLFSQPQRGNLSNLVGDGGPYINLKSDVLVADLTDEHVAKLATRNSDLVFHLADIVAGINYVASAKSCNYLILTPNHP